MIMFKRFKNICLLTSYLLFTFENNNLGKTILSHIVLNL